MITIEQLQTIGEETAQLTEWSLIVLGGSIAVILSTSYISPVQGRYRLFYLLFIPGWALLASCIYWGDQIRRNLIAAVIKQDKENVLLDIFFEMNTNLTYQIESFQWAIVCFGLWLIVYLLWWIFILKK